MKVCMREGMCAYFRYTGSRVQKELYELKNILERKCKEERSRISLCEERDRVYRRESENRKPKEKIKYWESREEKALDVEKKQENAEREEKDVKLRVRAE